VFLVLTAVIGQVIGFELVVIARLARVEEIRARRLRDFGEVLDQLAVIGVDRRAVAVLMAGIEAQQGRGVVLAFVKEDAVRAQFHHFMELAVAQLQVFLAVEAHEDQALGVDVQQLRGSLVLVAHVMVVITVRVFGGVFYQLVTEPLVARSAQVNLAKRIIFTPKSWIWRMAALSSSKVPRLFPMAPKTDNRVGDQLAFR
jgi:hypothetical protein